MQKSSRALKVSRMIVETGGRGADQTLDRE